MDDSSDLSADTPKGNLPGVVGLLLTVVLFVIIFIVVGAVSNAGEGRRLQKLRDSGQEVVAVVVSKDLEAKATRRNADLKADFVYEIAFDGELRTLEVVRDSFVYGTVNVGDSELACLDPEDLSNVEFYFPECGSKLDG